MMLIPRERSAFHHSAERLRRARRLWVRLIKPTIEIERDPALHRAAENAKSRGLYSANSDTASVQYSILRKMSILDGFDTRIGWWRWHAAKGWVRSQERGGGWCSVVPVDAEKAG